MSRFVRPDTTVLKLSLGDTLTVKRRLNSGEQRAAYSRMYLAGVNGSIKVNPLQTGMALITAYLLDWSLVDDDGNGVVIREQPIEVVMAALDALDPESFTEIKEAIEAHEQAMLAAREAQKKMIQAGEPESKATLRLPSDVTGPSIGSVN